MLKALFLFLTVIILSSCFLFKDYKKKEFAYNVNGQNAVLPLIVPKGYSKAERRDTAGISLYVFTYPGGSYFYAAHLQDTTYELQSINKKNHQPLVHRLGGQVYKGQDQNDLFYREIRQGAFRFGYRFVDPYSELQFDSATNFASLQRK